jgi:putative sigma-54 modulation protein
LYLVENPDNRRGDSPNILEKEWDNMRYIISGKNIEVTDGLKNAIYEKLDKLDKFFSQETECMVTLSVEKFRQKAEVTIPMKGNILRAEEESDDMYVSIDVVSELLERQVRKFKTKITHYNKGTNTFTDDFLDQDYEDEEEVKIIRSKKFAIKPMDAEEACIQMELLGHNFYVFRNAETFEVNVVYKRKGNTYGLIEPEF